jgi:Fe-S cluster assembly protein SufD
MSFTIDFNNKHSQSFSDIENENSLSWLNQKKQQCFDLFKTAPVPNRKIEHWKYNDMNFLGSTIFQAKKLAQQNSVTDFEKSKISFSEAIELLIVDGELRTDIETLVLPKGIILTAFTQLNEQQQSTVKKHITPEFNQKNLLLNLNEAINQQGILIEVEKKQSISVPVYIRYINTLDDSNHISSQKVIVSQGQSSQMTLVEQFETSNNCNQLSLQQTTIDLLANSNCQHYRLNLEQESAKQISQVKTFIGDDAQLNSFYLGLGSVLNRTDIDILHQGRNGNSNITGIYLPNNAQNIDYHSNVEHQVSHCQSNEKFRGIIADKASATFNGKIHIFQDAQKSDAYLNNKNLLLTNQAQINTKPELEIYADDVVCAHGATVAQLDKKSLYYMQARGLNEKQAKRLLSIGFIQELLNKVEIEALKDYLTNILEERMSNIV